MESFITTKSLFSEIQHAQEIANKDLVPRCVSEKRQQSLHLTCLSQIFTVWVHQIPHPLIMLAMRIENAACSAWEDRSLNQKNDPNIFANKKLRPFLQNFWLKTIATDQTSKLKHKQLHFVHLRVKLPAFTSLAKVSQRIHTISANKINLTPRKHFIIFCLIISCLIISCPTCPPAWSRSWPAPRTASPSTWSGRARGCCTPRCTLGRAPPSS